MARSTKHLVEPSDLPPEQIEAISLFIASGWQPEDARWLAPLSCSILKRESSTGPAPAARVEADLHYVARSWMDAGLHGPARDPALLMAYVRLFGCGGKSQPHHSLPAAAAAQAGTWIAAASEFRSHGANFEAALLSGSWPGDYGTDSNLAGVLISHAREGPHPVHGAPELVRLMQLLVEGAGLDLSKVVDEDALVATGSRRSGPDPAMPLRIPAPIDRKPGLFSEPRNLTNWMIALGPQALTRAFPDLKRFSDQTFAALAVGLQDAIERWLCCRTSHWTHFRTAGPALASVTASILEELARRCPADTDGSAPPMRRSWLWFAWCTYEADPDRWQQLPPQVQERIFRAANHDLAALRELFARATPRPVAPALKGHGYGHLLPGEVRTAWEEFEWERGHFETCAQVLYSLGGVWRGMKPLLLALRALASPSVAQDLRYWPDATVGTQTPNPDSLAQPPEPWAIVPGAMINLFHWNAGREQRSDPALLRLRGDLARFCLERLADRWSKADREQADQTGRKRTNEDMMERSPEWRLCLIRAAAALHLNPEGKGHRLLTMSADLDPDEDVREAAREAYQQFRRFKGLPENVSPRRTVMTALWWIRQAHLLGLGIQPDPDGAQRTRVKELTRTKEAERDINPAVTSA